MSTENLICEDVNFFSNTQKNLGDIVVRFLQQMAGITREIDEARKMDEDGSITDENKQKAAEHLEKLENDHKTLVEQGTALWNFLAEVSVFLLRNKGPKDYFKDTLTSLIQYEETKYTVYNKCSQLYYEAKTLEEMYDKKIQQLLIDLGSKKREDLCYEELLDQLKKLEELPGIGRQIAAFTFTLMHKAPLNSTEDGGGTKMDDPSILPIINPMVFKKMPKELTVVFLGETGVGKSTFINGLANYLKHATMYDAMKKGVDILIKSYFTYTDDNYQRTEIRCGSTIQAEDGSDVVNEAGQSSTQHPKCYRFVWNYGEEQKVIRIIDTPGVGNVRGVQQEKENFQRILSFLADFKEINAICILLKPNDSKLTVTFRYCISELLTHLHVSAATNILFCFTNARATLYTPGDTLPTLESYLKTLKEERKIKIECNQDTLFSFDNESFRFLCALMHGAKFTEKEKDNFNGSWVKSVEETFRLFSRISELRVHDVNKTLSINNIRSVILAMARPLAEIARNQLLNSQLIQDKINEIEDRMKVKDSLVRRLRE